MNISSLVFIYYVFNSRSDCIWLKNTLPSSTICFLNSILNFARLMSGHDRWSFLRIVWIGGFKLVKLFLFIRIFITDNKKPSFFTIGCQLDGPDIFLWFVPFLQNLRDHGRTPKRWQLSHKNCLPKICFNSYSEYALVLASRKI